jgi:hypothetical protein
MASLNHKLTGSTDVHFAKRFEEGDIEEEAGLLMAGWRNLTGFACRCFRGSDGYSPHFRTSSAICCKAIQRQTP